MNKKLMSILLSLVLLVTVIPMDAYADDAPGIMPRFSYVATGGTKENARLSFYANTQNVASGLGVNDYVVFTAMSSHAGAMSIEGTIFWSSPSGRRYDSRTVYDTDAMSLTIYADNLSATECEGALDYSSSLYGYLESAYAGADF